MPPRYSRRKILKLAGQGVILAIGSRFAGAATAGQFVNGHPQSAEVGRKVLDQGGNAIDAIVAAALTAAVVSPNNCGIGGYGGHMVIALAGGKITSIDFNTAAPSAATANMFSVNDRTNEFGWRAAGVPGTLAGLQFALERYGTKPLRDLLGPAIHFAGDGFQIPAGVAGGIRGVAGQLRKDPASEALYFRNGEPLKQGEVFRNSDLAKLLQELARDNSVESFYRGEIGKRIVGSFEKHGGLVTARDMAAYRAREVEPLRLMWKDYIIYTAPLTAGGLSVLEGLAILKALQWEKINPGVERSHALVESLRLAWRDRLLYLGDPEKIEEPTGQLLSEKNVVECSTLVTEAVQKRRALDVKIASKNHGGTIHLNSVDAKGNAVALTLTHGNAFGACVTVEGLGLTLGHGMSRFESDPRHPNAPGPDKRPLHNMCPTIVLRGGKPDLILGGTGGRLIPNAIFNVLSNYIGAGATIEESMAAPRPGADGGAILTLEKDWPEPDAFKEMGFTVKTGSSATVHAIQIDSQTGLSHSLSR